MKQAVNIQTTGMDLEDALLAYLGYMSIDIDSVRLHSGLPLVGGKLTEELIERAVQRLEYVVKWEKCSEITSPFPVCVQMASGGYLIAVSKEKGFVQLIDPSSANSYVSLTCSEFDKSIGDRAFRILPSIRLLNKRYSTDKHYDHWFWSRLFLQKRRILDVVASSLFANILAVVTSLFALQVYDRVIPGQAEATLWVLASGAGIAIFFEALLRTSRAKLIDQMGKEAEIEITRDIFSHVIHMKFDKRPASPGAVVHMVREFAAIKEFFTTASVGVVADLPFALVFLLLIYGIAGDVVWIIVAGAGAMVLPSLLLQPRMARLAQESNGGSASASRLLTEVSYGLETVKVSNLEQFFQKQWEEITFLNAIKTTEQRSISAFLTYWSTSLQQATYVLAVIAGVYLLFAGELTMGAIIAVSILSTRALSPIAQLSQVLSRWKNMKTALVGLDSIIFSEQERDPDRSYIRKSRLAGSLKLENVQFIHQGSPRSSINIKSLNVAPGTRLAILGVNGSGKSTLLKLLSGIIHPTEGEILIDSAEIRQIDPIDLRRNVGYLPQEIVLFNGTLRDNLSAWGHHFNDDLLFEALAFGGIDEFVRRHPAGLDLIIQDGGQGLSIGQRQSVGLSRLYLQDPSIVLLDEPTAALDSNLENDFVNRFGLWLGSRTCVVATHRLQILSQFDRIGVMAEGGFVMEGDKNEVINKLRQKTSESRKADH